MSLIITYLKNFIESQKLKKMKKIFSLRILTLAALAFLGYAANAQVKIGANPTTLNPGAILEMESANRGLLLPRLELTSTTASGMGTTTTGIKIAVAGMEVYNTRATITGTATYPASGAGIYVFDGTGWVSGSLPKGGSSGQVLSKASDNSLTWSTPASGIVTYLATGSTAAVAGAFIKATGTGVSFSVDVSTQTATITVPNGVELISARVFEKNALASNSPGSYGLSTQANLNIKIVYTGKTIDYTNTSVPLVDVMLEGSIPYYLTGTAARQVKIAMGTGTPNDNYTVTLVSMAPSTIGYNWTALFNF
jgi:hypothetical protein